ncbi:MAG: type II toxin-antitoxin system YafQ family toxin [Megasphaera elsdenii]|jgi:mRNA interferase YafQ|nr:type II toxin-antitoxin system YafQ family toxin [Megasphaera elsdenii]
MTYELVTTAKFRKDVKLMKKRGKNLKLLQEVIDILFEGKLLDAKYKDHALVGNYIGFRECHIQPD